MNTPWSSVGRIRPWSPIPLIQSVGSNSASSFHMLSVSFDRALITTLSSFPLFCWSLPHGNKFASTRPTIMMFHGNGGNHGHRIPLARVFFVKMRCNVLMVSYRGCVSDPPSIPDPVLRMHNSALPSHIQFDLDIHFTFSPHHICIL